MYKSYEYGFFKHIDFIILDSIVMQVAYAVSYMLRHGFSNPYESLEYRQLAVIMGMLLIVVSFLTDGYRNILQRGYLSELKYCTRIVTTLSLLLVAYLFVTQNSIAYSRSVILMSWIVGFYLIYMEHIIWKSVLVNELRKDADWHKILLVADDAKVAEEILSRMEEQKVRGFRIVHVVLPKGVTAPKEVKEIPVLQGLEEALQYISGHVVDEVFLYTFLEKNRSESFIEDCLNAGIVVHQNLKEELPYDVHQEITRLGDFRVLTASTNSATARQLFFKRAMDICGSMIGLVITGMVYLFVAPIIKIQSPGPALFKQERVGKNGRRFWMYKFRSMDQDAEERKAELMVQNKMKGPISKFDDDPRVFPFGKFIRNWSIDELPQFWNVLKGEMSLVGTRPPTLDEYEKYELHHKKRLAAKPGMTGLWQVSGRSDIEDFEEIIRLDSEYISKWRLSLDIKILFYTVFAVFRRKGAK